MILINSNRKCGVELLKVIAMFCIVIYHTALDFEETKTLITSLSTIEYYAFDLLLFFGYFGDCIFIVCTSYFLIEKANINRKKIIKLILYTLLVYYSFLLIYFCVNGINSLSKNQIMKSLLPISNCSSWYITCYIIFYFISPYINTIIEYMNQKEHFVLSMFLFIINNILPFLGNDNIFATKLTFFISTYFIVTYIKKYKKIFNYDKKTNVKIFAICLFINIILEFINYALFEIKLELYSLYNPFILLMAISLFNIFNNIKMNNKIINMISSLTLIVYLLHSNYLFEKMSLRMLAKKIIIYCGSNLFILKIIFSSFVLFIFSICVSYLINIMFNKTINKLSEYIYIYIYIG